MEDLRDIPEVMDYLLETEIYDKLESVVEDHNLPRERVDELLQLSDAVVKGQVAVEEMPAFLEKAFDTDEKNATEIARDLAGYHLLPLAYYIPDVPEYIEEWGGSIDDYPERRVGTEESPTDQFLAGFAARIGLDLPDALMKRFVYLASGYLSKDRARKSTKTLLMRRMNIGGLEMTEEQAENLLNRLDKEREDYLKVTGRARGVENVKEELEEYKKAAEVGAEEEAEPEVPETQGLSVTGGEEELEDEEIDLPEELPETFPASEEKEPEEPKESEDLEEEIELPEDLPETFPVPEGKEEEPEESQEPKEPEDEERNQDEEKKTAEKSGMDSETQEEVNLVLKPVVKLFQEKHIPRRTYVVSVGAFVRGMEGEQDLADTLDDYNFSSKEKEEVLQLAKQAHGIAQGKGAEEKESEEPEDKEEKKESLPEKAVTHALAKEVPVAGGSMLSKEEEREAQQHKEKTKQAEEKAKAHAETVEEAVNKVLQPIAGVFKKNKIAKRTFRDIAKAHVKGIREPLRTRQLLEEKQGLEGDDLETVMDALEQARKIAGGEVRKPEPEEETEEKIKEAEKRVLDKRHAAMTEKMPDEQVEPPVPSARVSAARTKEEELALQEGQVDAEKLREAKASSKPKPAKARLSAESVPPDGKKVTDVKFARRLVGPVDELRVMMPADFRRLSSDPVEAARKVEAKLDLLEETDYAQRINGVKAWRESPTNRLYMRMTNEALEKGLSVSEIASKRRNAGDDSLSPSEIMAILELNKRIKF